MPAEPLNTPANTPEPRYAVSPLNGARVPLGAHPKNTGGKKGRSGRRAGIMARTALLETSRRIPFLVGVVDGIAVEQVKVEGEKPRWGWVAADVGQRLKAFQMLDEIGQRALGTMVPLDQVTAEFNARLARMAEVIAEHAQPHMPPDAFRAMMREAGEVAGR